MHKLNWRDRLVAKDLDRIFHHGVPVREINPRSRIVRTRRILRYASDVRGGSLGKRNTRNCLTSSSSLDTEGDEQGRTSPLCGQQFTCKIPYDVLELRDDHRESSQGEEESRANCGIRRDSATKQIPRDDQRIPHVEKIRQNLRQCSRDHLSRLDCRRWVLHDIYENPGLLDEVFYHELTKVLKTRKKGVFLVGEHGDHWHVIHDCQYNGSWCRCTAINLIRGAKNSKVSTNNSFIGRGEYQRFSAERLLAKFEKRQNIGQETKIFQKSVYRTSGKTTVRFDFALPTAPAKETTRSIPGGVPGGRRGASDTSGEAPIQHGENIEECLFRRYSRRRYLQCNYSTDHWGNLLNYLCQDQRRPIEIWLRGVPWVHRGEISSEYKIFSYNIFQY